MDDLVFGETKISPEMRNLLYDFALQLEITHPIQNGATALYWHLLAIVEDHLKDVEKEK